MTRPEPVRRPRQSLLMRVLGTLLVVVIVAVTAFVAYHAVLLREVNTLVQATKSQSLTLANAQRETLLLLQEVADLDETGDTAAVEVQRGLLLRQVHVAIASYPAGSAEAGELAEIKAALARFPWDRLVPFAISMFAATAAGQLHQSAQQNRVLALDPARAAPRERLEQDLASSILYKRPGDHHGLDRLFSIQCLESLERPKQSRAITWILIALRPYSNQDPTPCPALFERSIRFYFKNHLSISA